MEEEKSEEKILAKSGESGFYGNVEESDPWSTGEIKNLKTKWLQQELEQEAPNDKELESSSLIKSSSSRRRSTSARLSLSRSSNFSRQHSIEEHRIDIGLTPHKGEPETLFEEPSISSLTAASLKPELKEKRDGRQGFLEYFDILAHLAFFGIIGVLIRYGLGVLFADVLSVTHESTIVYRDLPANMVGSFFMGWVGIVFKEYIRSLSEPLALGLSTGLMGSITTYAGWNQKMVVLLTGGNVASSISGLILGMCAAVTSLITGIHSAQGVQIACAKFHRQKCLPEQEISNKKSPARFHHGIARLTMTTFAAACLWGAALALLIGGRSSQDLRILWLSCLVAPPGVWMRWHLARFNGRGIQGKFRWLPIGTLLANLIGASLDGVLALLQFVLINDTAILLIGGLQLGFIGCLSTVSTFVAEIYTIIVGRMPARAYIYTLLTLGLGLLLCVFLYSTPAWIRGYVQW